MTVMNTSKCQVWKALPFILDITKQVHILTGGFSTKSQQEKENKGDSYTTINRKSNAR